MSAHWTHLNPAWKRARGCPRCAQRLPIDVHRSCRRALQLASEGASFNAADQIVGHAHSLTWAKLDAEKVA